MIDPFVTHSELERLQLKLTGLIAQVATLTKENQRLAARVTELEANTVQPFVSVVEAAEQLASEQRAGRGREAQ